MRSVLGVVVSFAIFCSASQAKAGTYTPHSHHVTARYTTAHFVTHHSRSHTRTAHAAYATPASHGRHNATSSSRVEPVAYSSRTSARRGRSTTTSLHHAGGRRSADRGHRNDRLDVVAETNPHRGGSHSSGTAHPDQEPFRPRASALPEVTASVDALPSQPASLQRSAPSDLVGAPQVPSARTSSHSTISPGDGGATREELAEEASQPMVLPGLYRDGRLVVPPPMRGTREILVHQNLVADQEGLTRIQDDDDLRRMRTARMLIDFPESTSLRVNAELAGDRRCARPWTVRFAADIARAYYLRFHQPLQVNSAVRTVAYQVRLRRVNGNAAGVGGEAASPHLTGEALDFGKRDMNTAEIAWMRMYLGPLMQTGKVDVEEEFQQACFHISVYRSYAPELPSRREYAQLGAPHVSATHVDIDQ